MSAIRLHIAESNFVIREGLKSVFDKLDSVEIVGVTAKSEDLKSQIMETNPQVLLINYDAHDFHASDVMQSLRLIPGIRVVGMTHTCDPDTLQRLLDAGIAGHLMSDCDLDEIVANLLNTVVSPFQYLKENWKFCS